MRLTNYTVTLDEFSRRFDEAVERFLRFHVKIGSTRIARYQKLIHKGLAAEIKGETDHQTRPEFANAVVEASELVDISTLSDEILSNNSIQTKLKFLSSGPEVMAPLGNDPARDYAFEFSTAARAHANERFERFHESGDLVMAPGSWPIECKRLSSLSQLERRVREARDQLTLRVGAGEPPGVIAIDVTRPLRIAYGMLAAPGDAELMALAEKQMTSFMARRFLSQIDLNAIQVPSVRGILVRYLAAGYAGGQAQVRRSTVWQAASVHSEPSEQNQDFLRVMEFLGPEPTKFIEVDEIRSALDETTAFIADGSS